MYLTFTYNGELNENIKNISHRYDYLLGDIYTAELSEIVCKSIFKEDYIKIKEIIRTLKIEKLSNNINNEKDFIFLNFFINNIDKIYLMEIE